MSLLQPPIQHPMVDQDGKATLQWIPFLNQNFTGDAGESWIPLFTSLTTVGGAPTITGVYYRLNTSLVYFSIKVVPATNTSSTAGTTYCTFPLTMTADGACNAVSGLLGATPGMCDSATNRIYVPAWSAVTVPLTITGIVEAS